MTPAHRFRRYQREADEAALVDLLTTETWEFRLQPTLTAADVAKLMGDYGGDDDITELAMVGDDLAGFVRAFGLSDEKSDPQLDYRFRARFRGQGLGQSATNHIVRLVFEARPLAIRIEAQTRQDNVAMRRVFTRCGFAQEAVYRRAWPDGDGHLLDGIGYAILRSDWESGTVTPVDWSQP